MATRKGSGTKSTSKKVAAKPRKMASKPPATRRRGKASAELTEAPPDKIFWVNFGPMLRNLQELRDAIADGISDAQFAHHVDSAKNDFANWVDHVLGDVACAEKLRRARTRRGMARVLDARLKA